MSTAVVELPIGRRTPAKRKARQLAATLRRERPDYTYLKELFRQLRAELGIVVPRTPGRLPYVPSEQEIRRYDETVWKTHKLADLVLIKTLLYTGVRVSELVAIRLDDFDFDRCQIRVNEGKGPKDRVVPFPPPFKETLALHADGLRQKERATCSSHRGRSPTATAASGGSSSATLRPPASPTLSRRIVCAISC